MSLNVRKVSIFCGDDIQKPARKTTSRGMFMTTKIPRKISMLVECYHTLWSAKKQNLGLQWTQTHPN